MIPERTKNTSTKKKRASFKKCPVPNCLTYKERKGFYAFPQDPIRRQEWLNACMLPPSASMTAKICWNHFSKEDFRNEIKEENIAQCKLGQLKKNVIPSQNLPLDYYAFATIDI